MYVFIRCVSWSKIIQKNRLKYINSIQTVLQGPYNEQPAVPIMLLEWGHCHNSLYQKLIWQVPNFGGFTVLLHSIVGAYLEHQQGYELCLSLNQAKIATGGYSAHWYTGTHVLKIPPPILALLRVVSLKLKKLLRNGSSLYRHGDLYHKQSATKLASVDCPPAKLVVVQSCDQIVFKTTLSTSLHGLVWGARLGGIGSLEHTSVPACQVWSNEGRISRHCCLTESVVCATH